MVTAGWRERIANPLADGPAATETLLRTRDTWGEGPWPSTTVFTSGVYGLLHLDHVGYLLHTKTVGAMHHFNAYHAKYVQKEWRDLTPQDQNNWWQEFIESGEIRLI